MAEENEVQEEAQNEVPVEDYYIGEVPAGVTGADLASYLEVEAMYTVKQGKEVVGYKKSSGFYKFGKDLDEARELVGDDVVFTQYRTAAKIKLQGLMRSAMGQGGNIEALLATWKPGVTVERIPVDPEQAAEAHFEKLSAEEQDAFIRRLMAKAGRA